MDVLPTGNMADDTLWGQDTFKMHPMRACRGYVNVKKFNASRNVSWLPSGTWGPVGGTLVRILSNGFSNLTLQGKAVTCYYVQFRGSLL